MIVAILNNISRYNTKGNRYIILLILLTMFFGMVIKGINDGFFISNLIFPLKKKKCKIVGSIQIFCNIMFRGLVLTLILHTLQRNLKQINIQYSKYISIFLYLCISPFYIFSFIISYYVYDEMVINHIDGLQICYWSKDFVNVGKMAIIILGPLNEILMLILLTMMIYKFKKISNSNLVTNILLKHIILTIIMIISSIGLVIVPIYTRPNIPPLHSLMILIQSWCLYLKLPFSKGCYNKCCFPFIFIERPADLVARSRISYPL